MQEYAGIRYSWVRIPNIQISKCSNITTRYQSVSISYLTVSLPKGRNMDTSTSRPTAYRFSNFHGKRPSLSKKIQERCHSCRFRLFSQFLHVSGLCSSLIQVSSQMSVFSEDLPDHTVQDSFQSQSLISPRFHFIL